MFPDYSTFNTYHRLSNLYSTLGDTIRLPIEGIVTAVYKPNGCTILTLNALHIPALRGPLSSLRKHHQIPGYGFHSSYEYGSYLFLPDFILQVEDSYDNIVSYWYLGASYQDPIDYIDLDLQVPQLCPHLQADHPRLLLNQHPNHPTSLHHMSNPYPRKLLYLPL